VPDLSSVETVLERPIEVAAGQIRSLDHPDFDHAEAEAALWTPLAMLQKGSAGIFFLEPFDPKRIPVLFVHGFSGTPRDFRHMIESLDRSRFQAWVFYYPTDFRTKSVVALLHDLLVDLEREHRYGELFITAHSLGGLISRSYVKSAFREGERVKLLVSFSSPWLGNSWAAVGARITLNSVPSWYDLSPESEFLVSLREPMHQGIHAPPHYVFFGFRRKVSLLTTESTDGVISISSQLPRWIQDQAERYWGYDATHVGILSVATGIVDACRGRHSTHVFTYQPRGNRDRHPVERLRNSAWRRKRAEVGLPGLQVHDLRRTFATRLRDAGVSKWTVSACLGHKDGGVTELYALPTLRELRAAVEALESLDHRHLPGSSSVIFPSVHDRAEAETYGSD